MPLALKVVWDATKELGAVVGKLVSVAAKLKAAPDKAAGALAAALTEVAKTHRVVHDALTRYLSLADDPHAFDNGIKPLLELCGGLLAAEIVAGIGHCHEIDVAYRDHLDKWFAKVLDPTEVVLMEDAFRALRYADYGLFDRLAKVGEALETGASEAIQAFQAGGEPAARGRLKQDFAELFALRSEQAKALETLRQIENEFRELATGTPVRGAP